jgi:hypothetical protein
VISRIPCGVTGRRRAEWQSSATSRCTRKEINMAGPLFILIAFCIGVLFALAFTAWK